MLYCHRTVLKKVWFNPLTKFKQCSFSSSSSSCQADLVDKGSSLPVPPPPPQSLLSPLMFVPKFDESESSLIDNNDYFHFFNPAEQKSFRVTKKQYIPGQKELLTPDDAVCVGSSHGWLAFVHHRSCTPYLFNPLIESPHLPYVPLPPYETMFGIKCLRSQKSDHLSPSPSLIKDFVLLKYVSENVYSDYNRFADEESNHFIQKLAMSSAPSLPRSSSPQKSDDNCTVVIIDGKELYFCKLGDERWHLLDRPSRTYYDEALYFCYLGDERWHLWDRPSRTYYDEIMYFSEDQRFYAMAGLKQIVAWDLRDPSCPKREIINPSPCPMDLETTKEILESNEFSSCLKYLVESSGDLLLVLRFYDDLRDPFSAEEEDIGPSSRFCVYKLNFDQNKWEPVECLSDRALFVGRNHSFSLQTRDYPELTENSIYFTDNFEKSCMSNYLGHDNGIFHLKDKSITPYYPRNLKSSKLQPVAVPDPVPDPVWVAPNKL